MTEYIFSQELKHIFVDLDILGAVCLTLGNCSHKCASPGGKQQIVGRVPAKHSSMAINCGTTLR